MNARRPSRPWRLAPLGLAVLTALASASMPARAAAPSDPTEAQVLYENALQAIAEGRKDDA